MTQSERDGEIREEGEGAGSVDGGVEIMEDATGTPLLAPPIADTVGEAAPVVADPAIVDPTQLRDTVRAFTTPPAGFTDPREEERVRDEWEREDRGIREQEGNGEPSSENVLADPPSINAIVNTSLPIFQPGPPPNMFAASPPPPPPPMVGDDNEVVIVDRRASNDSGSGSGSDTDERPAEQTSDKIPWAAQSYYFLQYFDAKNQKLKMLRPFLADSKEKLGDMVRRVANLPDGHPLCLWELDSKGNVQELSADASVFGPRCAWGSLLIYGDALSDEEYALSTFSLSFNRVPC